MSPGIPDEALCKTCSYSLRGLAESRCPECGRVFDPEDRTTYRTKSPATIWRSWAKPPPAWQLALVGTLTLVILWDASVPGGFLLSVFSYGCCFVPAVSFCALSVLVDHTVRIVAATRIRGDDPPIHRRRRWRWVVTPVFAVLLISVIAFNWPLRLRFHWSHSALQQVAQQRLAGSPSTTKGRQIIGLYRVEAVYASPKGVQFVTGWDFDECGFAYRPSDPWPNRSNRLAPGWYVEEW